MACTTAQIVFGNVTVCDDLQSYLDTPAAMTATFEYDTSVDDPLILTDVAAYQR